MAEIRLPLCAAKRRAPTRDDVLCCAPGLRGAPRRAVRGGGADAVRLLRPRRRGGGQRHRPASPVRRAGDNGAFLRNTIPYQGPVGPPGRPRHRKIRCAWKSAPTSNETRSVSEADDERREWRFCRAWRLTPPPRGRKCDGEIVKPAVPAGVRGRRADAVSGFLSCLRARFRMSRLLSMCYPRTCLHGVCVGGRIATPR